MNYKIVLDEEKLREFIEWLPELKINEKFYLALFARKKYCAEVKYIKTDKAQVKRTLATKKDLFNKIKQMEVPLGCYVIKDITIPQEALVLYISVNPRDMEKGTRTGLIKFANLLANTYNGYNPVAEALSEVHKAVSRKIYFDYDFDNVALEDVIPQIRKVLPDDAFKTVITKNGFHVLVELAKIDRKLSQTWYHGMAAIEGCDVRGDNLIPVVGCTQGGFVPHFYGLGK